MPCNIMLHFVTVCTICYLLLSCGDRSLLRLLSRWVTALACDHKITDNKIVQIVVRGFRSSLKSPPNIRNFLKILNMQSASSSKPLEPRQVHLLEKVTATELQYLVKCRINLSDSISSVAPPTKMDVKIFSWCSCRTLLSCSSQLYWCRCANCCIIGK